MNLLIVPACAGAAGASLGTVISSPCMCLGLPPVGALCASVGLIYMPVALAEIICGVLVIADPVKGRDLMKWVAWLEVGSVVVGALPAFLAGSFAMMTLSDPEVAGYLADLEREES